MSNLITTSRLSRFWTNVKSYIDTALSGKADASHTHDYAAATHAHAQTEITGLADALAGKANASHTHADYAAATHTHTEYAAADHAHDAYALKSDIPALDIATDAEIDALFQ
jgi:hypothetical protein